MKEVVISITQESDPITGEVLNGESGDIIQTFSLPWTAEGQHVTGSTAHRVVLADNEHLVIK